MQMRTLLNKFIFGIGVLFLLSSCATYQGKVEKPQQLLKEGNFSEAIEQLKALAEKPGDDQLVYLMEYGTALQMAGQFRESTQVFLKADRLADQVEYHSVTNLTLATLGSEEMIQYKGESYEKLLINASLALNYVMMGQFDDALVEARRINEKINKIRREGRENYEQSPFAHYLSGLLWESDQKFDDAYISYEQSYKLDATNPFLPGDLIRGAKKARREDSYHKWKKEFSTVKEDPNWYDKSKGEVVVIIEQGWGPKKGFSPTERRIPKLYPVPSLTQNVRAELYAGANRNPAAPAKPLGAEKSQMVYNVEQVAIKTLDADYGWMVARKVGAFAAKEVVADQIRQKNELLGMLAWIGMHASDRADLRQWSTLPQSVQMVRFWASPGTYNLTLQGLDGSGNPTADRKENVPVQVKPGRKSFYFWRTIR
jgi:hypothetical protein